MKLQFDTLKETVERNAAIRRVQRLQPVGGLGDKIFLPTHHGKRDNDPAWHVFETCWIDCKDVRCILIDGVQIQI